MTITPTTYSPVYEDAVSKERAHKALSKAKSLEHKRWKQGWRYIRINDRTQIQVPCDENGNPTEKGKEMLDYISKTCG